MAHTPPGTSWRKCWNSWLPRVSRHGLDLVLVLLSYRHAMKSSQVERKQQSSAWTKRETFLSSPTMGRRWLPGAAFGCKFGNGSVDHWTTHPNQSNIATAEIGCPNNIEKHRKTHLQSLPMCCCRSVGYFVGALVEVLCSEFFFFRCSIHVVVIFVYICSHTTISSTIVKRNAGIQHLDSVLPLLL